MADKKSFVFYINNKEVLELLTDEQLGHLMRLLIDFAETRVLQDHIDDMAVNIAYRFMTSQMKRDFEKYETVCKRRSEAGKKGGAQKGNKNASKQAKQAFACFDNQNEQNQAKRADNDNDNDNDILSLSFDNDNIEQACTAPDGAAQPAHKKETWEDTIGIPIEAFGDDLV